MKFLMALDDNGGLITPRLGFCKGLYQLASTSKAAALKRFWKVATYSCYSVLTIMLKCTAPGAIAYVQPM